MKVGDLVRYSSVDADHDRIVGLVTGVVGDVPLGFVTVIWSLSTGPYQDAVPMEAVEVISESR